METKLQKNKAFEAELTAHEEAIDAVRETGEELITSGHFAADEVERRIEALYLHWEELLEASANKGKRLEEARDHQKFTQEVHLVDSCISEKVGTPVQYISKEKGSTDRMLSPRRVAKIQTDLNLWMVINTRTSVSQRPFTANFFSILSFCPFVCVCALMDLLFQIKRCCLLFPIPFPPLPSEKISFRVVEIK